MRLSAPLRAGVLALAGAAVAAVLPVRAQQPADLFQSISFREVGPTHQGGRFVDFAVVDATPRIFYAASATGGLYKTENDGLTFTQLFEHEAAASIGAVAVAQSNPDVLYVGTGEGNNSRSTYYGDGVYKSTDAGKTWTNVGLKDSQHIGRIVVSPTDPNTVYVAALGHLYSDNEERGLYKSTDGGATWVKSLAVTSNGKAVGAVDVVMDPTSPLVLYAAAYDKVRRPWTFGEGGPGSGIYKTTDAGKTWTKLTGGLPTGLIGRIGLAIARNAHTTVYAVVENANASDASASATERAQRMAEGFGGGTIGPQLYRSDDAGKTWTLVAPAPVEAPAGGAAAAAGRAGGRGAGGQAGGGRGGRGVDLGNPPYYYSQVRVDPNDKEHIFILATGASQSDDGGKTWRSLGAGGDNHALWIDPKDSHHMLLGYDHGMSITVDGGQHWYHPENVPAAQCYGVAFDMATPYNVYCGLQDNGSQKGPSTMKNGGPIPFEAWSTTGGGDGQFNVVELADSRYLYNESQFGELQRTDQWTGATKNIKYSRGQGKEDVRFGWTAPIVVSPFDPNTIYHGANVVLKSTDRGDSWTEISPDLTVNDPARRNGSGDITYATLTALDESPIVPGLLWAGTDDGNVQVTRDGGKTWTNVRDKVPGDPGYWVSRIEPSHADPAVAYLSVTGLRRDDFRPLLWKTTDYGQTWTSLAANLPNSSINTIREDPYNSQLLFVGNDEGVYVSINGGAAWERLTGTPMAAPAGGGRGGFGRGGGDQTPRGVLATVPVLDLQIQPRDHELVLGTHGRGIWIADISPLEELTPDVLAASAHLFGIQPVILWHPGQRTLTAAENFAGQSRPAGAAISYYLKSAASGDVKLQVYAGSRLVSDLTAPNKSGITTVQWNLQALQPLGPDQGAGRGRGRGGFGGFGRGGGAAAPAGFTYEAAGPGEYRVVLTVGGQQYTQTVVLRPDPDGLN